MRDLHVVIASVGRASCASVAADALVREPRLSRLTIVLQACPGVIHRGLAEEARRRGIGLSQVVLPEPVGPARARHIGTLEGDEPFVGFLDDDIVFERGSLSALVDRCQREGLGGACGVVTTPESGPLARLAKSLLFRSIFRDPRPWAGRSRRPVPSRLLSGGMTVYRRALYAESHRAWTGLVGGGCGEDVELSFTISRRAALAIDPSVRVDNGTRRLSIGPADATDRALGHLARYRSFAARHATTAEHHVAYCGVLLGVLGRGLAQRAGRRFIREVLAEAAGAATILVRLTASPQAAPGGRRQVLVPPRP